ncbi:MAG: radical SAM/Cys-rich domain protein [Chitinophagales bacterium]|nr:radical SAM/Cys-rich domain protein [Chitinophagales bacterium]
MAVKSLAKRKNPLSEPSNQIKLLENKKSELKSFQSSLEEIGLKTLHAVGVEIFQVNVGKMCNQVCKHCHVDAGPDRKEIMTRDTMQLCLKAIEQSNAKTVDLTGGAPEMNPDFRWFVEEIKKLDKHIVVRCNLTIILHNRNYYDLPEFFKKHQIEVVSSLPFYDASRTDAQRGNGVFDKSIKALQMLNGIGYGIEGSGLILNLVYNPSGAFLPAPQEQLERDFKKALKEKFSIEFNSLFNITNLPVSRFLEYLIATQNYETYMQKLIDAFNPAAAVGVMCRNTISVGWDGYLYDCDFNQMLDMKIQNGKVMHLNNFNSEFLDQREIQVGRHCFGCTAGSGSSCGGSVT